MIQLTTPINEEAAAALQIGDTVEISGYILCGRDAVLPRVMEMIADGTVKDLGVDLHGQVIFHTAVSPAGVGPTSSNKLEIESSIEPLSKAGIKLHLGKGELHPETIAALDISNKSAFRIRWPKYWSFSFNISPSNEYSGLISFRMDWLDLLGIQGTLKSLLQHHSSKASILRCSSFFTVQLSHPYMTTG